MGIGWFYYHDPVNVSNDDLNNQTISISSVMLSLG